LPAPFLPRSGGRARLSDGNETSRAPAPCRRKLTPFRRRTSYGVALVLEFADLHSQIERLPLDQKERSLTVNCFLIALLLYPVRFAVSFMNCLDSSIPNARLSHDFNSSLGVARARSPKSIDLQYACLIVCSQTRPSGTQRAASPFRRVRSLSRPESPVGIRCFVFLSDSVQADPIITSHRCLAVAFLSVSGSEIICPKGRRRTPRSYEF